MTNLVFNNELNGIELYFDNKPMQDILDTLKGIGFRWSNFKKCWYAKQNEKTLKIAQELTANKEEIKETITAGTIENKAVKKEVVNISLWDATRWNEVNNVDKKLSTKEIAAEIRKQVKSRFPLVKFTVTSSHSSINFDIVSSPFEKGSKYLKAIQEYCTNLLKSYKYCTCYDPYGDYGSSYNFYGSSCDIVYNYIVTEQTEAIKTDMKNFDVKLAEFEAAEEERKEKEYQEREIQREEEHKQYLIRAEQSKKEIELINNSVEVKELEDNQKYFVIGSQFANMNKNQTLDQYKEEVKNNDFYLQNVKITKELHFDNEIALKYFGNHLLTDFDFLAQTGGSFTDDIRINSMTDYYNMTKEEQETVIFNLYGVAVYYNSELQFVIDAQGFSYARYVGLVENVTIEKDCITDQAITAEELETLKSKAELLTDISASIITDNNLVNTWNNESWSTYKELMKADLKYFELKLTNRIIQQLPEEMESLKVAMYKLLKEVDGIQEQFKNADIKPGQKITMFYISDWGSIAKQKVTFDSIEYTKYAQYDNAVKLTFIPQGKRNKYYNYQHSTILVYNGWLELPDTVLNTVESKNGMMMTMSKYGSCDKKQYDEIINYFESQGHKPIVNTYKPMF